MKEKIRGLGSVYGFTCQQYLKRKSFVIVTVLLAVLLFVIGGAVVVISAIQDDEEELRPSPVEQVYVLDQSGLPETPYALMFAEDMRFSGVAFETVQGKTQEELCASATEKEEDTAAIAVVTKEEAAYLLTILLPEGTALSEEDGEDLAEAMAQCLQGTLYGSSGVSVEDIIFLQTEVSVSWREVGEETDFLVYLIRYFVPAMTGIIVYMLVLLHGQNICKEVSLEKNSKVVETLLNAVHPDAMISGKVFAIASMAFAQFVLWVAALLGGIFAGNAIAGAMQESYENVVVSALQVVRENVGSSALSLQGGFLALLVFLAGCLLFFILAGVAGSIIAKPEDTANAQSLFVLPVIISWMVSYLAALAENDGLLSVLRYIPFTAPFLVPADLLTGSVAWLSGLLSLVLVLAADVLLVAIAGRIYRGLILYTGQKITWKTVAGVLRNK